MGFTIYEVKRAHKLSGVTRSKLYRRFCEEENQKIEKESESKMSKLDLRLPVMLLGGLPFNTIKMQMGNDKSDIDMAMLDACLNPTWIQVLRDMGTVRARLLVALANGIIDMSYGDDNILHISFNNPRFTGLDIDFNNETFDDIGFDFKKLGEEPEELLRYVLHIFKDSMKYLQKEWNFSDEYTQFLLEMLDVPAIDDDISLKDLADVYYVNRNRLPWRLFTGNSFEMWYYRYGRDGRTFIDYRGKQVVATKSCTPQMHVLESNRQMSDTLIKSFIGEKGIFEAKFDASYYDKSIDKAVEDRQALEDKIEKEKDVKKENTDVKGNTAVKDVKESKTKGKTAEKANEKEAKVQDAVNLAEKKVVAAVSSIKTPIEKGTEIREVTEVDEIEENEKVDYEEEIVAEEETIENTVEPVVENTDKGTGSVNGLKSAVSAATRSFLAAEARADKRYNTTEIDNMLTGRVNYVPEKIESSEEAQKRFSEVVKAGNSLIVVDCENAKVETIWGNIFRFTTKSTMKGQKGKLWLNAKVLFVHDNDSTESADWATMINVFKKMVVVSDSIEDIRVNSIKMEKAQSLTDVVIGVHVGRLLNTLNTSKSRALVILSSDSDMAGIIQASKSIDPGIQFGVCYSEQATGRAYRAWCNTNNICTFNAEHFEQSLVKKYKDCMYDYIYEERYKDIIKGAVSDMMERQKGSV